MATCTRSLQSVKLALMSEDNATRPALEDDLWALASLRPLASAACHHSAALNGVLLKETCPLVNILPRQMLRRDVRLDAAFASERPPWDALLLTAAPKAGSTLLRKKIVPELAPKYRNVYGKRAGEENDAQTCEEQQQAYAAAALPSNVSFSALVVREPLSRFVAGIAEVMRSHCADWLRWREENDRSLPGHAAYRVHVGTKQSCAVRGPEGVKLDWHEPEHAWPLLKRLFVQVCQGATHATPLADGCPNTAPAKRTVRQSSPGRSRCCSGPRRGLPKQTHRPAGDLCAQHARAHRCDPAPGGSSTRLLVAHNSEESREEAGR